MDSSRVDRLVGRLAESGSRRPALGMLGISALVAGGMKISPPEEGDAGGSAAEVARATAETLRAGAHR